MALSGAMQVTAIAFPVLFAVMGVFYVLIKVMLRFSSSKN